MRDLQLKHAKQTWLSLSFIQTKMQVRNGQVSFNESNILYNITSEFIFVQLPFWSVNDKYKEIMPDDIQQRLMKCLQFVRVDLFSSLLYECIVFIINVPHDDEFDNSKQR